MANLRVADEEVPRRPILGHVGSATTQAVEYEPGSFCMDILMETPRLSHTALLREASRMRSRFFTESKIRSPVPMPRVISEEGSGTDRGGPFSL